MAESITETIARALQSELYGPGEHGDIPEGFIDRANLAVAAITQADYAIVPVEPTEPMQRAVMDECVAWECFRDAGAVWDVADVYRAMITTALDSEKGE